MPWRTLARGAAEVSGCPAGPSGWFPCSCRLIPIKDHAQRPHASLCVYFGERIRDENLHQAEVGVFCQHLAQLFLHGFVHVQLLAETVDLGAYWGDFAVAHGLAL